MNIQVDPTSSNLASAMLNSKTRPRAVVGYGVKIFHPSPPNYVTRSPGERIGRLWVVCVYRRGGRARPFVEKWCCQHMYKVAERGATIQPIKIQDTELKEYIFLTEGCLCKIFRTESSNFQTREDGSSSALTGGRVLSNAPMAILNPRPSFPRTF